MLQVQKSVLLSLSLALPLAPGLMCPQGGRDVGQCPQGLPRVVFVPCRDPSPPSPYGSTALLHHWPHWGQSRGCGIWWPPPIPTLSLHSQAATGSPSPPSIISPGFQKPLPSIYLSSPLPSISSLSISSIPSSPSHVFIFQLSYFSIF